MAKRQLADVSAVYMTVRATVREAKKYTDAIQRYRPAYNLVVPISFKEKEVKYYNAWKRYIEWEKGNPQNLEDEKLLQQRVIYAYQQAVEALRFYPEIWTEAAQYLWELDEKNEALKLMIEANKVLPQSSSVLFLYTEYEESFGNNEKCHKVYKEQLELIEQQIAKVKEKYAKTYKKIEARIKAKTQVQVKADMGTNAQQTGRGRGRDRDRGRGRDGKGNMESESELDRLSDFEGSSNVQENRRGEYGGNNSRYRKIREKYAASEHKEVEQLKKKYTMVYIAYLRFGLRAEGINEARAIFKTARTKDIEYITYHLFVASAMIEFHVTKNSTIAGRIFEYGLKHFFDCNEYVSEYLKFLINMNDDNNTRALFERVVSRKEERDQEREREREREKENQNEKGKESDGVSDEKSLRGFWDLFSEYENLYFDLSSIYALNSRILDTFKRESPTTLLVQRYTYLDLDGIALETCAGNSTSALASSNAAKASLASRGAGKTGKYADSYHTQHDEGEGGEADEEDEDEDVKYARTIKLASITNGKFLSRNQLLHSVKPKYQKTYRPDLSHWSSHKNTDPPNLDQPQHQHQHQTQHQHQHQQGHGRSGRRRSGSVVSASSQSSSVVSYPPSVSSAAYHDNFRQSAATSVPTSVSGGVGGGAGNDVLMTVVDRLNSLPLSSHALSSTPTLDVNLLVESILGLQLPKPAVSSSNFLSYNRNSNNMAGGGGVGNMNSSINLLSTLSGINTSGGGAGGQFSSYRSPLSPSLSSKNYNQYPQHQQQQHYSGSGGGGGGGGGPSGGSRIFNSSNKGGTGSSSHQHQHSKNRSWKPGNDNFGMSGGGGGGGGGFGPTKKRPRINSQSSVSTTTSSTVNYPSHHHHHQQQQQQHHQQHQYQQQHQHNMGYGNNNGGNNMGGFVPGGGNRNFGNPNPNQKYYGNNNNSGGGGRPINRAYKRKP
ncbi:mRNA 3'-end-processing protein RNA14 [Zancudomyces culisetae]|uniref:mRNA 3'-end-processing protein RNA14 n=1 Tax=Zancudomyces culisetae TaxID=1213189 RepID=A0A1R1PXC9_ZANCU|nr:mRNA 3'-end-processing protein RNA14 [Zancudomyces culisetae]OMH85558.1 mRNA 3'-end-processing protein RNA14 [Zancudomyces culisetae]|eukprot:OMH81338.1 mRNA 3'-end-processing protein RNA14 [Zancudomyces culisetae]